MIFPVPSRRLIIVSSTFPLILHWVLSTGFFVLLKIVHASQVVMVFSYLCMLDVIHRQFKGYISLSLFNLRGQQPQCTQLNADYRGFASLSAAGTAQLGLSGAYPFSAHKY